MKGLFYYSEFGGLQTFQIEKLETVQVPNNYSAGCSLHSDVATQGILVGAHNGGQYGEILKLVRLY